MTGATLLVLLSGVPAAAFMESHGSMRPLSNGRRLALAVMHDARSYAPVYRRPLPLAAPAYLDAML